MRIVEDVGQQRVARGRREPDLAAHVERERRVRHELPQDRRFGRTPVGRGGVDPLAGQVREKLEKVLAEL